jgi:PPOX class probable F420-dependent enzyme
MTTIPEEFTDLLTRPLTGGLATVRPDGQPESSPMWFLWDGTNLKFTHTTLRNKLASLEVNPYLSLLVIDPDNAHRYLQVRGRVESVEPDPTGAFFVVLARRYGLSIGPRADKAARVIITARVVGASYSNNG